MFVDVIIMWYFAEYFCKSGRCTLFELIILLFTLKSFSTCIFGWAFTFLFIFESVFLF